MLTKQNIPLAVLKNILEQYDLGRILGAKPLKTSGNISYIIKTRNKSYLLRLSPMGPRWRSRNEISAEIELLEHLSKNNFPVIRPVASKKGNFLISWKRHNGYLREYVNAKEKINPTLNEIKKFGEILGQFHKLIENYKTINKRNHSFGLVETRKYFLQEKKNILKQQGQTFLNRFSKEISGLTFPSKLPRGMIHEDLGKRHILWKNSKIIAVIDFDRCYFGKLVLDLGEACRGWCFKNDWKNWSGKNLKSLLTGYLKNRKLTELEKKFLFNAIKFAVLERALAFYTRFLYVTHDRKDGEYAFYSVDNKKGLIGMLNKNRKDIQKIIKAA